MSQIDKEEITSLDDIEFKLIQEGKLKESQDNNNYINNKEFYEELCKYHQHKMECLERGESIPPLTDKIGRAIIQIATRRCNSRNYIGYTNNWKEEMISNAITLATLRGHNFDPNKSTNPFAYFTQICDNAIKEQLNAEKKQLYVRYKSIDNARGYAAIGDEFENDPDADHEEIDLAYEDRLKFINDYEERRLNKKTSTLTEEDRGVFRLLDDNGDE